VKCYNLDVLLMPKERLATIGVIATDVTGGF